LGKSLVEKILEKEVMRREHSSVKGTSYKNLLKLEFKPSTGLKLKLKSTFD